MRKNRLGIALVIVGVALTAGRIAWSRSRTYVPVDMPVSLSIGHIRTFDFKLNLRKLYLIEIEAQKTLPFGALNCMLGIKDVISDKCENVPSVLKASWSLSNAGAVIVSGSSTDNGNGDWTNDTVARQLGSFVAEPGRLYRLDVDVMTDGSFLNQTNPRLKIAVDPQYYEESALWDIPVFLASVFLLLMGATILWKGRRRRPIPSF